MRATPLLRLESSLHLGFIRVAPCYMGIVAQACFGAVFVATCLAAVIGTLIMGLWEEMK